MSDKPRFADVVDEFVEFIQGAELIIHNAPFDVGFIDAELKKLGKQYQTTHHYSTVLDTLVLARKTYPGQRNSLDALCKRLGVTHHERTLHGALLDSEILADVYLRMTGGQGALSLQEKSDNAEHSNHNQDISNPLSDSSDKSVNIKVIEASQEESVAHQEFLQMMSKKGSTPIWHQAIPGMTPDV